LVQRVSEVLTLASMLRDSTDEFLLNLTRQRGLATANLRDFFDLADALLSTRNLQAAVSSLSASELSALKNLSPGNDLVNEDGAVAIDPQIADALLEKCLIKSGQPRPAAYDAVTQVVNQMVSDKHLSLIHI
jgi:hypothetical protein